MTTVTRAGAAPVGAAPPAAAPIEVFRPRATANSPWRRVLARARSPLGIYLVPLLVLAAWQIAGSFGWLSSAFAASPVQIYQAGTQLWHNGQLGPDLAISLTRAGEGFALGLSVGLVGGVVAGLWRAGEQALHGLVVIMNTIPLLALLPLMVVWFGIGEQSKVMLIAIGAAIPVYLNLFSAIRGVDRGLVEMAVAAGAGRFRLVTRLLLPGAMPGLLVGLRFALAYSVLGLVAAEQINADSGIGFMISQAQTYERVDEIYFGLVVYAILGLLADLVVRLAERLLLSWRPTYQGA
jgi:sulfonate transport system permease protein